jgi:type IV secretory pathway ATPase VirB11/archaellum biosynthesis ATPase
MDEYSIRFDPAAEIDRFFDDSSIATVEPHRAVIIAGGVASGKTTLRRAKYPTGYVVLDAAEIFLGL